MAPVLSCSAGMPGACHIAPGTTQCSGEIARGLRGGSPIQGSGAATQRLQTPILLVEPNLDAWSRGLLKAYHYLVLPWTALGNTEDGAAVAPAAERCKLVLSVRGLGGAKTPYLRRSRFRKMNQLFRMP
jgi:hypothetical protein